MAQTITKPEAIKTGSHIDNVGLSSFQKLNPRQQEVFVLLVAFIKKHCYPPTAREQSELIGAASTHAVAEHLRALRRKGVITIAPNMSRGISVSIPQSAPFTFRDLPTYDPGPKSVQC